MKRERTTPTSPRSARIPMLAALALAVAATLAPVAGAHAAGNHSGGSGGEKAAATAATRTGTVRSYQLKSNLVDGKMVFIDEKGAVNPVLKGEVGDTLEIRVTSGEGAQHDIVFPELGVHSAKFDGGSGPTTLKFKLTRAGRFAYICSVPGHRQIGMEGTLEVTGKSIATTRVPGVPDDHAAVLAAPAPATIVEAREAVSVAMDPTAVPQAVGKRAAQTVSYRIETVETVGKLADGTTFEYWTFDKKVPGPMLRVRVGDTVNLTLANAKDSKQVHSIDLHAVTGPGGGAEFLQVPPGKEKSVSFKALNPGLYVYHCATPMVPHHISAGMYGLILVEPEGGLPKVDREFYVMQGDIYTKGTHGMKGHQEFDTAKLLNEQPDYYVFNGQVGALTQEHKLTAKVGETVRIYFGVGGPNKISSFHVIGEIFDKVYNLAATDQPLHDVQTTLVAPGGAAIVEFKVDYPGRYVLVDHALSRAGKGLVGVLQVEGEADPSIYRNHGELPPGGAPMTH